MWSKGIFWYLHENAGENKFKQKPELIDKVLKSWTLLVGKVGWGAAENKLNDGKRLENDRARAADRRKSLLCSNG